MNMFAPERPRTASNQPAILGEGGYIPHVIVSAVGSGLVRLSVMLRNYADTNNRSYSYRFADLYTTQLNYFFDEYIQDPEMALKEYFNWEPRDQARDQAQAQFSSPNLDETSDLL